MVATLCELKAQSPELCAGLIQTIGNIDHGMIEAGNGC